MCQKKKKKTQIANFACVHVYPHTYVVTVLTFKIFYITTGIKYSFHYKTKFYIMFNIKKDILLSLGFI